ncbi:MAG: hypothetical protein GW946_01100 [Candidatus Pacebacteria bacterium]|nr:hypothetical protein [Candidatus Paceibacterota bacterium]PIR60708.1 MAG: hypothetical protein COU67_01100 [Candidatus Pacebacteria bacterium CG10_big_fil_rev_8_21_14_0_10_44_54]
MRFLKKKLILVSIATILTFVLITRLLRIQHITCSIEKTEVCSTEELYKLRGTSIFFVNLYQNTSIAEYERAHNIALKSYHISLPQTLEVDFTRKPELYTVLLNDTDRYSISDSGTAKLLTGSNENTDIQVITPTLFTEQNTTILPIYHHFLVAYVKIIKQDKELPKRVLFETEFVELQLSSGGVAFLPYEHTQEKIKILQHILDSQALSTLPAPIKEVDLRFDLPVLRTQ